MRRQHDQRYQVEAHEGWNNVDIPEFDVPPGWNIKLVPPFAGALARMLVTNQHGGRVSVYFDALDALGVMGRPYWEVYPIGETTLADPEDPVRFLTDETSEMVAFIETIGDPVRAAIKGLTGEDA